MQQCSPEPYCLETTLLSATGAATKRGAGRGWSLSRPPEHLRCGCMCYPGFAGDDSAARGACSNPGPHSWARSNP
ncbi:hypothetical protein CHLRE_13g568316v5 [Chlamydomonas reinhardtii]|uniref:Uncharacterized protein n=1 Tax=Chlamydomonas reinhardtii TaxID=3055 RepID=A0A2K3CZG4_CHLRE|nr:uncharacterized protein CHLRE_13g568316v5 [Chlamydomonas reinhardtii]PNW73680.1 hypothetical protein CHLRE_13g568316v5 [Chlamydomonas reinhardtii]